MWAYVRRSASSWSHLCTFWPKAMVSFSTRWLCHITSAGSGTVPNIFWPNRFTT